MDRPGFVDRQRERLALGAVRAALEPGEQVLAWGHVQEPHDGRHGILALTKAHCVVHWSGRDRHDAVIPWDEVTAWDVVHTGSGGPVLCVRTGTNELRVRLPVSTQARARRATALLSLLAELAPAVSPRGTEDAGVAGLPLRAERRGVRGHTRRVLVTVAGFLLILLGLLFASPFLPGPGTLTVLAGLAVLATEYDLARDLYHWVKERVERFWERRRLRRARRRAQRVEARDA